MRLEVKQAVALAKEMISIPSESGAEAAMGRFLYDQMHAFGFEDVRMQNVAGDRANVIGKISGEKPGPTLLFTGHMDVVAPGDGWGSAPYSPLEKDGRIYGRGACDMKAGLALCLTLGEFAAHNRAALPGTLQFAFAVDEEAYSAGAHKLIEEGITADFGIAAEPHPGPVVIGACGKVLLRLKVKGKPAHGMSPGQGINAIEECARALAGIGRLEVPSHPKMAGQPFVTLKVEGGYREYAIVVPEDCEAIINKHIVPGEDEHTVVALLQAHLNAVGLQATSQVEVLPPYYPAYALEEDQAMLQKLRNSHAEVTGEPLGVEYAPGVSDNNLLATHAGIPCVCYGPAGQNLHAANEWVSIASMESVLSVYRHFVFG